MGIKNNIIDPYPTKNELERRLSFFKDQERDHYEEKKVGTKWYVKNLGKNNTWCVDVYTEENYRKYNPYKDDTKQKQNRYSAI